MNNCVETYILEVLTSVRCKKAHQQIRDELTSHIEDLREEYEAQGISSEEATQRAVSAMGDASEVGQKLNRQHKPQMGWGILLLTAAISLFGVLSMCITQPPERYGGSMENYLTFMAIGALFLVGIYFFDYTRLKKHPFWIYLLSVLLVFMCSKFGYSIAGTRRYLSFGIISLYIPGTAAVLYLISFCGFLERFRNQGWTGIFKLLGLAFVAFCSLLELPCFAFAFILTVACAVVLLRAIYQNHFSADGKVQFWSLFLTGSTLFIIMMIVHIYLEPYRTERIMMFLNKGAADPLGSGWVYMIADKIMRASKWIGKAGPIPEGDIAYLMPDLTGDFALLNIVSSYGKLIGLLVIITVSVLIVRMFAISRRVKYSFGRNLSLSCCVILSVQFIYNILMNLGFAPIMGVTLPFVSYGGSLYLINSVCVGLILSVWRQNNILAAEQFAAPKKSFSRISFVDNKLVIDFSDYFGDFSEDYFEE